MRVMNAQIEKIDLGFKHPMGTVGKNFICFINLLLANKGHCLVELNPARLPEFMELLNVNTFNSIEGNFLQVKLEGNKRPNYVKSVLADESDEWFSLDNGIYFGSRVRVPEEVTE